MNNKYLLASFMIVAIGAATQAHNIDLDQIKHWTGTGPNRAALAIQFNNDVSGDLTRVWGYRWEDGETPNGEQMFRAIAADTKKLVLFTQFTGVYGSTVCGIGYDETGDLVNTLRFDFEGARDCEYISFDYYSVNSYMGQSIAPGDDTPELAQAAIDEAYDTRVIQHPIDQREYGYPAYDYDFWQLDEDSGYYDPTNEWQAGWYYGYWSYWIGTESNPRLDYSGVGYSGHPLKNGGIEGWSYSDIAEINAGNPPGDGYVEYVIDGDINLFDGDPYRYNSDVRNADVIYNRNFKHTGWQALYLPFAMNYNDWKDIAEIAEFTGVSEVDGVYSLKFTSIQSGQIKPHTPYIIKPKNTGDIQFKVKGTTINKAPATNGKVSQQAAGTTFTLSGVYEPTANLTGCYALKDGVFMKGSSAQVTLSPYRIFLSVSAAAGQRLPAQYSVKVEDGPTSTVGDLNIDIAADDVYYDMAGRKVINPQKGLYIKNGKKVLVK